MEEVVGDGAKPHSRAVNFSQTALARDLLVRDELEAGRLRRPFEHVIQSDFGLYVVAPGTPRNPAQVQRMRDWLVSWNRPRHGREESGVPQGEGFANFGGV